MKAKNGAQLASSSHFFCEAEGCLQTASLTKYGFGNADREVIARTLARVTSSTDRRIVIIDCTLACSWALQGFAVSFWHLTSADTAYNNFSDSREYRRIRSPRLIRFAAPLEFTIAIRFYLRQILLVLARAAAGRSSTPAAGPDCL
jgi:hypothetical protein